MPVPNIKRVANLICSDKSIRRVAAAAVKEEVDNVYGYSKYVLREIDWDLESRLYSMAYLAKAIVEIIRQPKVEPKFKKMSASSYLHLLEPYVNNELPKPVYDWGFEPNYTLEIAVFLDSIGELEWKNYELLELITTFGAGSTVETKKKFLELFVDHINQDEEMLKYFTSTPEQDLENQEVPLDPWDLFPILTLYRPEELNKISSAALNLLKILSPIISSKLTAGKNVSLKALGKLKCLTREDIIWIMDHLIFFRIPNGVKACEDLYEILLEKGEDSKVLLDSLISNAKKDPKSQYSDERKIKGLLRTISKLSIDKSQLVNLTKELLDAKTGPDAKLSVYQFVYKETKDKEILERAKNERAKKIREWALEVSKNEAL